MQYCGASLNVHLLLVLPKVLRVSIYMIFESHAAGQYILDCYLLDG